MAGEKHADRTDTAGSTAAARRVGGHVAVPDVAPLPGGLGWLLFLITAVQALSTLAVQSLPVVAPLAAASLGLDPSSIGYQTSLLYLAAAATSAVAGGLVVRHGAGTVSMAATALSGLALVALAAGSLPAVALASLAMGVSYGSTNPAASLLLQRYSSPVRRNLIFSLKQTGVPIGGMLAALLIPALAERHGWQQAMLIGSLMFVALLAALWPTRRHWDAGRTMTAAVGGNLWAGMALVRGDPRFLAFAVLAFCYSGFQVCLWTFAVTMLVKELGWPLVAAGGAAALMQVGGVLGRLVWGALADITRKSSAVLVLIGLLSVGFAVAVGFLTPFWPPAAVYVFMALFGACSIGWNGVYLAEVARVAGPQRVSDATGGVLAFSFAGVVVGPSVFAWVAGQTGSYTGAFRTVLLLPLAGAAAFAVSKLLPRRR